MPVLLDQYTIAARIRPVVIVLLPAVICAVVLSSDNLKIPLGAGGGFLVLVAGTLLGQMGRDFGKRKERALWLSWGGPPTVRLLRHEDKSFSPLLKARCKAKLAEIAPDLQLPSSDEETVRPKAADEAYGAATKLLILKTRDKKKFPLLFAENVSYGFRRNLWGMKPAGLVLSIVGVAVCSIRAWREAQTGSVSTASMVGAGLNGCLCCIWVLWVTPEMVRLVGNAYAERLLETCEVLSGEATQPP